MAIIRCNCNHPGQDAIHGSNRRVANKVDAKTNAGEIKVRCTVCENEVTTKA